MTTPNSGPGKTPLQAAGSMAGAMVDRLRDAVRLGFHMSGSERRPPSLERPLPGSTPGIESISNLNQPPSPGEVAIECHDYGPDYLQVREVGDLAGFLQQPRPAEARVRWLNICGLNPYVVNQLREAFQFHTLAAEDVLRVPQRPKVEVFDGYLFIVVQMLRVQSMSIAPEQVSLFLFENTLITFQEEKGDMWDPIRLRLQKGGSRLRTHGTGYLLYALLDAVVDHFFPALERVGDLLEAMEGEVTRHPTLQVQQRIHRLKRELSMFRRIVWPQRELLSGLLRDEVEGLSREVKAYLRDVYDHAVQVLDLLESYREMAAGLSDLYMSAVSNRMNEIMKVLTIMASFFIPITFVAGVYGMNFEHIPELHWKYSYAAFWVICLGMILGLAVFFYRRGWLGAGLRTRSGETPPEEEGGGGPG